MVILGFGYDILDSTLTRHTRKFFVFEVEDLSPEDYEDLDQNYNHPNRDEWDDVLDEAIVMATTDCCDAWSTSLTPPEAFLRADYNKSTSEENLLRGCEILRNYFVSKGMACSAITEYNEGW